MTSPTPAQKVTAHELARAIEHRYEPPEWLLERELTLDGRRLDMVAFNMWTSRDHRIVGFEIKVSRGDWMRELANLQKNERWMEVVDSFYVVTPPKLIQLEELPRGWGLLELCGTRMMTRAHAEVREKNRFLPRELAARMLIRMNERLSQADRALEADTRRALRTEIEAQLTKGFENGTANLTERVTEAEGKLRELRAAAGLSGDWRSHEKLLRALVQLNEVLTEGDSSFLKRRMTDTANEMQVRHGKLLGAIAALDGVA